MKNNTTTVLLLAAAMSVLAASAQTVVDTYKFTMNLKVPRIYDNMKSLGYRKLQSQKLTGDLQFVYKDDGTVQVRVKNLVNRSHSINGSHITYTCYDIPYEEHDPLLVGIGSNKTGKFKQGGAEFAFLADPSYNIGGIDEDNTLILELSGYGTLKNDILKNIKGSVKGQIGCGCMAYGHKSPTRLYFGFITDIVYDIAPVYGTFRAIIKSRRIE